MSTSPYTNDNRLMDSGQSSHPHVVTCWRGPVGPAAGSPLLPRSILKRTVKEAEVEARVQQMIADMMKPRDIMLGAKRYAHRPHEQGSGLPFPAMVTRIASRAEAKHNPKAREAVAKEWAGLRNRKVWIEANRRSKKDVIAEAKLKGEEVQFSSIYGIIGEKGSELPEGDPRRNYKGRGVLLGNKVFNQDFETATFGDMGNAPTFLEGARVADCYGCIPGRAIQTADAIQAYAQAPMRGTKCWV